jgi:hypothetical protein
MDANLLDFNELFSNKHMTRTMASHGIRWLAFLITTKGESRTGNQINHWLTRAIPFLRVIPANVFLHTADKQSTRMTDSDKI